MNRTLVTTFGLLLTVTTVGANCCAAVLDFDGGGDGTSFLNGANWNDELGALDDVVPGPDDRALINDSYVVTYGTSDTTTVGSLIVGADWPVTGDLGTPGTLNMSDGKLIVTGGGDNFQIGRACCAGDGAMYMTGDAVLEINGSDPIVGTRENGILDVAGTASVISIRTGADPTVYWRLGNYGPSSDAGLEGNGLLNVHENGSFSAHVIFVGDRDSSGELRVADNGSVVLTGNLVPRPSDFFAGGSATIRMIGSSATLEAFNLESESLAGEIATKYVFDADASGVSPIKLTDAINITNNELIVNLNGYDLPNFGTLLLFDGDQALAGNRLFGTFASSVVNGSVIPHRLIYDQANGDILVQRVPEPSTLLLAVGMVIAACARRRQTS